MLLYDRKAAPEDVIPMASDYLARKWQAALNLPRRNWTLEGPLENPPARVTDKLPLLPRADDLPSTFYVDYVRAWKRKR